MAVIRRLLVANRGEIARRVFATCRRLGIETVAVHSDADAALPYVREADTAVHLPGDAPTDTYLRIDLLIEAAKRSGADAVHPGYGFLSENAAFARAVLDAGLTWVGPSPASIQQMGSKVGAKKIMRKAGVPTLEAPAKPTEADLPLLVKASAGGGGRGMRVVRSLADLNTEVDAASAEALSAFGDGTVFLEPYVERGRHVEVQVVGHDGGVLVLGERDCSIQRRHQKVVEESPAPRLPDATRALLHEAARAAAAAIDYRGAGTVEFLYDEATDRFYFLEMNTRLQVEHPVTELVHGVDLVELQLTVAEGRTPDPQVIGMTYGHAIEVRLYAEDPTTDWQPQSGLLTLVDVPGVDGEFDLLNRPGLRLDAGVETGSTVTTHYDAMLAKVVSWAPTREQAARRLAAALRGARIHGVLTNRDLLVAVLEDPGFVAGEVSTAFLDEHPPVARAAVGDHAVAAALALAERDADARRVQRGVPVAWRNVVSQPQVTLFTGSSASASARGDAQGDDPIRVEWWGGRDGYVVEGLTVVSTDPTGSTGSAGSAGGGRRVTLERDGVRTAYDVAVTGDRVDVDAPTGHVSLTLVPRFTDPADAVASGSLLAPMPGTVVRVAVAEGDAVEAGQTVLVLEAMKMQHAVTAPGAGTVTSMAVRAGAQVAAGEVLAVVSTGSTDGGGGSTDDVEDEEQG
jgi:propionyl-CoA carboxylase alpha chain